MKIQKLLEEQLLAIKPSADELRGTNRQTEILAKSLKANLKKAKISADVFVGGSSAKGTIIKKEKYDIDIFVRFAPKYEEEKLSGMLKKALPKNAARKKGSRDYFSLQKNDVGFEIVPVLKISKPAQARNITDLSYFHVNYVKKQILKHKKLADEIRLAKAFAYYQECYGAESYINGFSGYALELLAIYYKSFMNFIRQLPKIKKGAVIDIARHYKDRNHLEQEMNKSKLQSPIVLIDPTFKERNALAALSAQTLAKFQKACRMFLAKPSKRFFELEDKERVLEQKYGKSLMKLKIATSKQAGDIAGTKLKKFYRYFIREAGKFLEIKASDFGYNEGRNIGTIFLLAKPRKQVIVKGPPASMERALKEFKKRHKKIVIRAGKAYAVEKPVSFSRFLSDFRKKCRNIMKQMSVRFE